MRYRVYPYRQGSKAAKALADSLGGRVLKLEGSGFKPTPGDVIINWGNTSGLPPGTAGFLNILVCSVLNDPEDIRKASNKLKFFRLIRDADKSHLLPRWWENRHDIPSDAYPIVCRTSLAGHSGEGIVIAETPEQLVPAGLYVQYVKKKDEYRVHCGKAPSGDIQTIAIQRKARRLDHEEPNWQIRSHDNGFIYARNEVDPPASIIQSAHEAFRVTALDFGAVDVIWNDKEKKAYVLEINTAPGLEGQTPEDYAEFFRGLGA